jgi:quercetin dioxygenase-like cupin family protein
MSRIAIPDVARTPVGLDGVVWNVLGQAYIPKEINEERFVWYAIFPEDTFVPPHAHAGQDEFLMPLDGNIDLLIGGRRHRATAGEATMLPRGIAHAFFNNSGKPVAALFWATPAGRLVELYRRLHNVGNPRKAVGIAPAYGVSFEPPPTAAA